MEFFLELLNNAFYSVAREKVYEYNFHPYGVACKIALVYGYLPLLHCNMIWMALNFKLFISFFLTLALASCIFYNLHIPYSTNGRKGKVKVSIMKCDNCIWSVLEKKIFKCEKKEFFLYTRKLLDFVTHFHFLEVFLFMEFFLRDGFLKFFVWKVVHCCNLK